jgi:hypothetical protein
LVLIKPFEPDKAFFVDLDPDYRIADSNLLAFSGMDYILTDSLPAYARFENTSEEAPEGHVPD